MVGPAPLSTERVIRVLGPSEVVLLVDWAAQEGWNPGLDDHAAFRAADAQGFLGAFVEGKMVAGIAAIAYDAAFGFIGLYICRPDWRGRGHGKALWDAGIARLAGRTIGLDGVPAQQANYRRMGFEIAYRTTRYSGVPDEAAIALTAPLPFVRQVTQPLLPDLARYDRRCFPAARAAFLGPWTSPPHVALASLEAGEVRGYGVARRCREGWKLGPLFAREELVAKMLLLELAREIGRDPIHIDVPETARGFAAALAAAGLVPGFETARMYKGPAPDIAQDEVYGITTLELG